MEGGSRLERRLHTHPTLEDRVRRVYGRPMQPVAVAPVTVEPEAARRGSAATGAVPGEPTIASLVDPFARFT